VVALVSGSEEGVVEIAGVLGVHAVADVAEVEVRVRCGVRAPGLRRNDVAAGLVAVPIRAVSVAVFVGHYRSAGQAVPPAEEQSFDRVCEWGSSLLLPFSVAVGSPVKTWA
jgi:hypothetical protein